MEERDDHRRERDHHRRQHNAEDEIAPGIVELGEAVARQRAGEQIEKGHADGHEQAVEEVVTDRMLIHGVAKVVPLRNRWNPLDRRREDFAFVLSEVEIM